MQDVQTERRFGEPFTMARTRWMLGFQRRLVRRCEWLIDMPKEGCLPHTSHTDAMTRHLFRTAFRDRLEISITIWTRWNAWGPATSDRCCTSIATRCVP